MALTITWRVFRRVTGKRTTKKHTVKKNKHKPMKFNSICHRPFIRDFLQFVALLAPMHFLNPVGRLYLHHDTNPTKRAVLALLK